jgi:PAS domain S-box-containing protein
MSSPINILIVDDEPKNLTVLESILTDPSYRLVRAASGDDALFALMEDGFALLILDIHMPDMTGFELANIIKERKKTSRVPIIFLTAYYNEDQHLLEGYVSGAVDYLHKPINATILRSKVAVFAELHRNQREIESSNRSLLKEVDERRRTEEQLRELNETLEQRVSQRTREILESERQFRQMIDGSPTAIYTTDENGYLTHFNPAAAELVGRTPEVGQDRWCIAWQTYTTSGEEIPQEETPLARALKTGRPVLREELLVERPDGKRIWSVAYATPIMNDAGQGRGGINVLIDVSEFKRIELELRDADRRKDEFLATLAHELRNPLTPIVMAIPLIKENLSNTIQVEELSDVADRHLKQLIRLVDDLLDVARISRGRIELQKQVCHLQEVVSVAVESVKSLVDDLNHSLTINLSNNPIYVFGDPARLNQIVANILSNAIKYTPADGNISLDARLSGDSVIIEVKDNGIGIPDERLTEVFDLFTQLSLSNPSSYTGLGVGLALAKQLVEMHEGRIEIFSEGASKGTRVNIHLPTVSAPEWAISPEESFVDDLDDREKVARRVLVVDDLRGIRITMSTLIERLGHQVMVAGDGASAFELIDSFQPEVIFSDISMPIMDGFELASKVRSKYGSNIFLVAMTGFGAPGDRQRAVDNGFDIHMTKPPDINSLRKFFRTLALQSNEIG